VGRHPDWDDSQATTNLSRRRYKVSLIVLHHTAGTRAGDLPILLGQTSRRVSADFYVQRDGKIHKLNPQLTQWYTWHAGNSDWRGKGQCNLYSIGVEMEHRVGEGWPEAQVKACAQLCAWLIRRFGLILDKDCIQSHRAIALPLGRKTDPENYPWADFSRLVRSAL
jgi:AmpD protein